MELEVWVGTELDKQKNQRKQKVRRSQVGKREQSAGSSRCRGRQMDIKQAIPQLLYLCDLLHELRVKEAPSMRVQN